MRCWAEGASRRLAWGEGRRRSGSCWWSGRARQALSASLTAAVTPSTTGTPVAAPTASSSPAMPPQPRQMTSAPSCATASSASATMAFTAALRLLLEFEDGHAAGAHRGASGVEPGELEPVLDERDRAVERRDDGVLVAEQRRDVAGRLGDVDDGHIAAVPAGLRGRARRTRPERPRRTRPRSDRRCPSRRPRRGSSRSFPRPIRRRKPV